MPRKISPYATTRRTLLQGLVLGAGSVGVFGASRARAALLPAGKTSVSADVVVIGTGMAGLAAALEAAQAGAKVVVIEKKSSTEGGGNSRLAGGLFAVPRDDSDTAKAEYIEDFTEKCRHRGNSDIFRMMSAHSRDGIAWLTQQGVEFRPQADQPPYRLASITASPSIYMGMPKLLSTLLTQLAKREATVLYDTKAKQLIMDDGGAVAGVRAVGPQGVVDYRARAVIVAAGGYAGNPQILAEYADPNADAMLVRGITWATGDGLMMAQAAGAGLRNMGGLTSLHIAAVNPRETAAGNPWAGLPYGISINMKGERFVDESKGYVSNGKATLEQPGQRVSVVIDSEIAKLKGPASSLSTFRNLGLELQEADTLAALAAKIGVPAERFEATVGAFNAAVADGKAATAVPAKATLAYRVEKPPFYAFSPLVPGITLTFGGIMIDTKAQVLEADGRVIAGLYAAGEGAGHPFFDDYIGGGSLSNCLVMGRIAGIQAARRRT